MISDEMLRDWLMETLIKYGRNPFKFTGGGLEAMAYHNHYLNHARNPEYKKYDLFLEITDLGMEYINAGHTTTSEEQCDEGLSSRGTD